MPVHGGPVEGLAQGPEEGGAASRREDAWKRRAQDAVARLRAFVEGAVAVPILVHPDPDPDAVAAAFGLRVLLGLDADAAPIVTLRAATRPENRRMMELLHLSVTEVTADEIYGFERLIAVDTQPRSLDPASLPRLAVVDHHPPEPGYRADFTDIRPDLAAASTLVTEYLWASADRPVGRELATALLYGIKTDSADLTRSVTPHDVLAYAFLQRRADLELLHRIERPMVSLALARTYGRALAAIAVDNAVAAIFAGRLEPEETHVLSELADFALTVEGVCWAAAAAVVGQEVSIAIRHLGGEPGAGALARRLAAAGGEGGGHATMARVTLRRAEGGADFAASLEEATAALLDRLRPEVDALRACAEEDAGAEAR